MEFAQGFLQELKRRKVVRAAVVYAAAAFAVLEFADIAFPRLGLPDGAVNAVLWLGLAGFPLALLLAWSFDVHAEGEAASRRRWLSPGSLGVAVLLVMLGVGAGRWWRGADGLDPVSGLPARSTFIAVLPFANLSGDGEPDYFSAGLSEDVGTALSRFPLLGAIPPSSLSDARSTDTTELGRELGVRYVLRGSVRRDAAAIRVAAQLLDARSGVQLWAETYDRDLTAENLFAVQEDIAARVAATIADSTGVIVRAGANAVRGRPTSSLDAYECVLRGHAYIALHTEEAHQLARECLERAVDLDPGYSDAWAHLAYVYREEFHHGYNRRPRSLERAMQAGRRASRMNEANPMAHYALAMTHFSLGDSAAGIAAAEQAIALNPSDSTIVGAFSHYMAFAGEWERGLALARRAMALNPAHPSWLHLVFAVDHFRQRRYEQALAAIARMNLPEDSQRNILLAAIYGQLGREAEARATLESLRSADPAFAADPVGQLRKYLRSDELVQLYLDGLRKAGLEVSPVG